MRKIFTIVTLVALAGCDRASESPTPDPQATAPEEPKGPTAREAHEFLEQVDKDLRRLVVAGSMADWEKSTNITDETEKKAAKANEELIGYTSRAIRDAVKFKDVKDLAPEDAR